MTAETVARVNNRIQTLQSASKTKLKDQWRRTFKSDPPNWPPDLLKRAIANRWQEGVHGGLAAEMLQTIDRLVAEHDSPKGRNASSGTRIVRHWRGEDHHVLASEGGYVYRQRTFSSLTAVAKTITGQHMSGPAFFGVTSVD